MCRVTLGVTGVVEQQVWWLSSLLLLTEVSHPVGLVHGLSSPLGCSKVRRCVVVVDLFHCRLTTWQIHRRDPACLV